MQKKTISLAIHPFFWIFAAIIGFLNSFSLAGTLLWVAIIFISVLFHEFGHALAALTYGKKPRIELVAFGGVTFYDGSNLSFLKQFVIVLCGPLFGFLLFLAASVLLQFEAVQATRFVEFLLILRLVNLFWTVLNLMPILPLDGGHLLRIVLEAIFGYKGMRYSQFAGFIFALALSIFFFLNQSFLIGAIFFLFAFQCYDVWRKSKAFTAEDQSQGLQSLLQKAQEEILKGNQSEAIAMLEEILQKSHKGVIFLKATEYLALLNARLEEWPKVYNLLRPQVGQLSLESLCMLHQAAFLEKDYEVVEKISGKCFQDFPSVELAVRSAYACGYLQKTHAAVGWLQAALQMGLTNAKEIVEHPSLESIRDEEEFKEFVRSHL